MTAPLPTAVVVGPHVWRIDYSPDAVARCIDAGDRGRTHVERHVIEVDVTRPPTAVAETVLHELLHVSHEDAGADAVPKLTQEVLELVVTLIAPRLLGIIRANPALVEYLATAGGVEVGPPA